MQSPHFESALCALLKLSGHSWEDPIYMLQQDGCFFGYIYIYIKNRFNPSTHPGNIRLS